MSGAYARPELLASPDWLAENLGRPEVRVLDVRWRPDGAGKIVFAEGHLPGASHLDWREALTDGDAPRDVLLLAPPDQVGAALASVGVGSGTTVVLYDDTASLYAARAWWSLRVYGLDSVRILDGGFAAGRDPAGRSPRGSRDQQGGFTPRAQLRARLTRATSGRSSAHRAPWSWTPARPRVSRLRRHGHPARAHPGRRQPAGRRHDGGGDRPLLDGTDLRDLLSRAGVTRELRVVCYDGTASGPPSLPSSLALMGHDDVAVYDGGWPSGETAWSCRSSADAARAVTAGAGPWATCADGPMRTFA